MDRFEHGGDIYGNPNVRLDFSVNVNPLGMPQEVRRALTADVDEYIDYPDPACRALRNAIAAHEGVPQDYILCGNGAADLIYRLCYAVRPRNALIPAPTFSEYERALEQTGCEITRHVTKVADNFALTEEFVQKINPGVDIIFLCSPNNPTGRLIDERLLEQIIRRASECNSTVVTDECFLDFTRGVSVKKYLNDFPNLCVLKAFTKIYAMAGLRLGYMLTANKRLLEKTEAAGQSWSVSVPAQRAGLTALSCEGWAESTRKLIERERAFLTDTLNGLGIAVYPSDANFLLLRAEKPLYGPLLKERILIRRCGNFFGLDERYYRICVKTRKENLQLTEACRAALS
jgi:threonine-phosphate decarboxylase